MSGTKLSKERRGVRSSGLGDRRRVKEGRERRENFESSQRREHPATPSLSHAPSILLEILTRDWKRIFLKTQGRVYL